MEIHSHRNYYKVIHNRFGQREGCSNELERVAFLKKLVHVDTKQAKQTRGKQTIQIKTWPTLKNNNNNKNPTGSETESEMVCLIVLNGLI